MFVRPSSLWLAATCAMRGHGSETPPPSPPASELHNLQSVQTLMHLQMRPQRLANSASGCGCRPVAQASWAVPRPAHASPVHAVLKRLQLLPAQHAPGWGVRRHVPAALPAAAESSPGQGKSLSCHLWCPSCAVRQASWHAGLTTRQVVAPTALVLALSNVTRICMAVAMPVIARNMEWGPSTQAGDWSGLLLSERLPVNQQATLSCRGLCCQLSSGATPAPS